jgi:hypothetical protein
MVHALTIFCFCLSAAFFSAAKPAAVQQHLVKTQQRTLDSLDSLSLSCETLTLFPEPVILPFGHEFCVILCRWCPERLHSMSKRIYFNAFHMNCVVHQSPGLWVHPDDQMHRYTDRDTWRISLSCWNEASLTRINHLSISRLMLCACSYRPSPRQTRVTSGR